MSDRTDPTSPAEKAELGAAETLASALGSAAKKAGIDPNEHENSGRLAWAAIGGWRGVAESSLPTIAFVVTYTLTPGDGFAKLWPALVVSVGAAAIFSIIRLVSKQTVAAALGGLVAAVFAATIALITGSAADTFLPGLITNLVYGLGILIFTLAGWSIPGLVAGFLMGDATAWRRSKRKRRTFFWLGIAWAGLFLARLAVQYPAYLASHEADASDESVALLGTLKLVMGIPLFALMIVVTWFVVRRIYYRPVLGAPESHHDDDAHAATDDTAADDAAGDDATPDTAGDDADDADEHHLR